MGLFVLGQEGIVDGQVKPCRGQIRLLMIGPYDTISTKMATCE